jgi:hypothetical protein
MIEVAGKEGVVERGSLMMALQSVGEQEQAAGGQEKQADPCYCDHLRPPRLVATRLADAASGSMALPG